MSDIKEKAATIAVVSLGTISMIIGWASWPLAIYALSVWWDIHWGWTLVITAFLPMIPFGGIASFALAVYGVVLLLS